jgi:hypothetical protein
MKLNLDSNTHSPPPSLDVAGSDQIPGHPMTPALCRRILSRQLKCLASLGERNRKSVKKLRAYLAQVRRDLPKHEVTKIEAKLVNDIFMIVLPQQVLGSLGQARSINASTPGQRGAEGDSSCSFSISSGSAAWLSETPIL